MNKHRSLRLLRKFATALFIAIIAFGDISIGYAQESNPLAPQDTPSGIFVQDLERNSSFRWSYDLPGKSPFRRNQYAVTRTFRETIGSHWMSTVRILQEDKQLCLGVIVDENGWFIGKSSELPDGLLSCRLHDTSRVSARVVSRRSDLDLALLKMDKTKLPAIDWSRTDTAAVGAFIATIDSRPIPIAIGVVSVPSREIRASQAVLGVRLDESDEGVIATKVLGGGGAAAAGILADDVVVAINGQASKSLHAIQNMIASNRSGDRIRVTIKRDGKQQDLIAQLTDMNIVLTDPTEAEVNGEVSARASDFASAFQHDTVLTPNQCGGPLVNLEGHVVGLNIARAGRVHCYALPMDILVPAVEDMLKSASMALGLRTDGNSIVSDSPYSSQLPSVWRTPKTALSASVAK